MRLARLAGCTLLLLTALGLYRSRNLAWGGADLPDGTRYKVSPAGISHVLEPSSTVSPSRNCRWSDPTASGGLCAMAPGAGAAFTGLRLVQPLLYVGAGLAVWAALVVFGAPTSRMSPWLTGTAVIACLMAPTLFGYAAPPAIQSLSGLGVGVGGTLGTLLVAVAGAVLGGFTLAGVRGPRTRVPARGILSAIGVILPLLAFIRMFPLPEGLGFLVPGLGAGLGAGHWLSKEQLRDSAMG